MPWSPYHGNESLEHSFLVANSDGEFHAFDSYEAHTDWGVARPVAIEPGDWEKVPITRTLGMRRSPDSQNGGPVRKAHVADGTVLRAYMQAVETGDQPLSQLAIDTWLMARGRLVNLAAVASSENDLRTQIAESQAAWASAAEFVYMALRRARRGRPVPDSYKELVEAAIALDVAVAEHWEN